MVRKFNVGRIKELEIVLFLCPERALSTIQGSKIGHSGKLYFFRGSWWYSGGRSEIILWW